MLGPILFLIYVNDLPDLLQGAVLLVADEVKLISAGANFDDFQRDLQHVWDWASAWDIPLNENKCGHISFGSAPARPLTLFDNFQTLHDSTKDLGITI